MGSPSRSIGRFREGEDFVAGAVNSHGSSQSTGSMSRVTLKPSRGSRPRMSTLAGCSSGQATTFSVMHPINQVDICLTRNAVHGEGPRGFSRTRMTCQILFPPIGLCFDDSSPKNTTLRVAKKEGGRRAEPVPLPKGPVRKMRGESPGRLGRPWTVSGLKSRSQLATKCEIWPADIVQDQLSRGVFPSNLSDRENTGLKCIQCD